MLTVTDTAAKLLAEAIASRTEGSPQSLRIAYADGEYALTLDDAGDEDQVIEHDGQPLLIMDAEVSEGLADAVLDAQETEAGPSLTLTKSSD